MANAKISADEFVEYAMFLFGGEWRNALSAKLGMSRKSLVMALASGEQIPSDMTLAVLELVDQRLDEMRREQALLRDRINTLRGQPSKSPVPSAHLREQFQHAC